MANAVLFLLAKQADADRLQIQKCPQSDEWDGVLAAPSAW